MAESASCASKLRNAEIFSLLQDVLVHKDILLISSSAQDYRRRELIWRNIANKLSLIFNKKRTAAEVKKKWSDLHCLGSAVLRNQIRNGGENLKTSLPYMSLLLAILKSVNTTPIQQDNIHHSQLSRNTNDVPGGSRRPSNESFGANNNSHPLDSSREGATIDAQQLQLPAASAEALSINELGCDVTDIELPQELSELLDTGFQLEQTVGNKSGECEGQSVFSENLSQTPVSQPTSSQLISNPSTITVPAQSEQSLQTKAALQTLCLEGNYQSTQAPTLSGEQQDTSSHSSYIGQQQSQQLQPSVASAPSSQPHQGVIQQRPHVVNIKRAVLGLSSGGQEELKKELEVITLKRKYLELKMKTLDSRQELLKRCLDKRIKKEI